MWVSVMSVRNHMNINVLIQLFFHNRSHQKNLITIRAFSNFQKSIIPIV